MEIRKYNSIKTSERIFSYLEDELECRPDIKISGLLEVFYNCREQGYSLRLHNIDYSKNMIIWAYGHRNSDQPTITFNYEYFIKELPMFSEDDYRKRTKTFETEKEAAELLASLIVDYFKNNIKHEEI